MELNCRVGRRFTRTYIEGFRILNNGEYAKIIYWRELEYNA